MPGLENQRAAFEFFCERFDAQKPLTQRAASRPVPCPRHRIRDII